MEIVRLVKVQWDRSLAAAAVVAGAIALILGFVGVAHTPYVDAQLPYFMSGGLVGIFLLGVGAVLWITADLRDEWRELHAMRLLLDEDIHAHRPGGSDVTISGGGRVSAYNGASNGYAGADLSVDSLLDTVPLAATHVDVVTGRTPRKPRATAAAKATAPRPTRK